MLAEPTTQFPVSERSRVRLFRARGSNERAAIFEVIDASVWGTIAYTIGEQPYATPMIVWREDDWLFWHGSAGNRSLRAVRGGAKVCVTLTHLDGFVLSRLASAHSLNYRSVMAFGRPEEVTEAVEKRRQMRRFMERLFPGRWDEVVAPSDTDMRRILMVRMRIEEASVKARSGPPGDGPALFEHKAWAGTLPVEARAGAPAAAPQIDAARPAPSYLAEAAALVGRRPSAAAARTAAEDEAAAPTQLLLSRAGVTIDVAPGQSLLEAVLARGVEAAHSCRRGECRTCAVRVVSGEAVHRDSCLSEAERAEGLFCLCVSRARGGRLEIDL